MNDEKKSSERLFLGFIIVFQDYASYISKYMPQLVLRRWLSTRGNFGEICPATLRSDSYSASLTHGKKIKGRGGARSRRNLKNQIKAVWGVKTGYILQDFLEGTDYFRHHPLLRLKPWRAPECGPEPWSAPCSSRSSMELIFITRSPRRTSAPEPCGTFILKVQT